MTKTINISEAYTLIQSTRAAGQTFGAVFTKRSDGSIRTGSFRLGVSKGVTGEGLSYDPASHGLVGAFDMNKTNRKTGEQGAFIMINLPGLQGLTIDGQTYNVRGQS